MNPELPQTSGGDFVTCRKTSTKLSQVSKRLIAGTIAGVLLAMSANSFATADELDDKKREVKSKISRSNADLAQYRADLSQAEANLSNSRTSLESAQQALQLAIEERVVADQAFKTSVQELSQAYVDLGKSTANVAINQQALAEQEVRIGQNARITMQQQSPLVGVAILVKPSSTVDMAQRLQWSDQVFNSTQNQIDSLSETQIRLEVSQKNAENAQTEIEVKKQEAADNLATKKELESKAAAAEAAVAEQVKLNEGAEASARSTLAAEEANNEALRKESADIDARIAERVRQQRAAEAERQRKAAEAERQRQAAASRSNSRKTSNAASSSNTKTNSSSQSPTGSGGLAYPVNARITSPYGYRIHPILKYRRFHDGTDFGASCGTPIRAAAAGVVTEKYYSNGYGHRLLIDHGKINGNYVTTAYNHATGYIVSRGQRVSQGQVVGYVGTTGMSTGCHLHFMTWKNGTLTNPMTFF